MEMDFNFAERINDIEFVNVVLSGSYDRFILGIDPFNLRFSNPTIVLYSDCIEHQKSERFSNLAEYLYYSLMYKSITPIPRYKSNPIANDAILLRIRDLKAKYKSIASFVDRSYSIFEQSKFNRLLRLKPISDFIVLIKSNIGSYHVTIRFNYLSHIVTKLYTEPNTTIKILTYLLLLR